MSQAGEVRQAGHQVYRAYRVADRFVLLCERFVRVGVGFILHHPCLAPVVPVPGAATLFKLNIVVVRLLAAFFEEKARQRLVTRLPGDFIQTHQRQLDFRMPGIAAQLAIVRAKNGINMIGKTAGYLQQAALTGGVEERHRRFEQVPCTVHFVAFGHVGPA